VIATFVSPKVYRHSNSISVLQVQAIDANVNVVKIMHILKFVVHQRFQSVWQPQSCELIQSMTYQGTCSLNISHYIHHIATALTNVILTINIAAYIPHSLTAASSLLTTACCTLCSSPSTLIPSFTPTVT
jgi:hypothetical protein